MTKNGNTEIRPEMNMYQMLDEYRYERPKRGQFLDGEVMQIDHDRILIDLGAKTDAVVPPKELKKTNQELLEGLSEGDIVPVFVLKPPSMLRKTTVSIQRGMQKKEWDRAQSLLQRNEITKAKVAGKNKGGLLVQFGNLEGFLPASLIPTVARAQNRKMGEKIKANLVGEELFVRVVQVEPRQKNLILSARLNQEEVRTHIYPEIKAGKVRTGIIVNLVDYGAFIDLLGADGLIHISEIGENIDHPSDALRLGDKIEVKILEADAENERISLSRKSAIDPIESISFEAEQL